MLYIEFIVLCLFVDNIHAFMKYIYDLWID
jgi:hypothetical protein